MGLTNNLSEITKEADVIIAGGMNSPFQYTYIYQPRHTCLHYVLSGGTAACVVAGRLAEADPELSILVVEGGQDNYNVPNIVNPLMAYQHLLPKSKRAILYKARASRHLAGRESLVQTGGTLGGGSSINLMM